jgi:AcrR family transcriptional regulator
MVQDRRAVLTGRLADHLLAHGLGQTSLRVLAPAVGTSDRMLLYYFRDKDDLLSAAALELGQRFQDMLTAGPPGPIPAETLLSLLLDLARTEAVRPYLALWLDMAGRAAYGDPLWQQAGRAIGLGFRDWIAARLDLPAGADPGAAARALLARIEGEVVLGAFRID